MKRRRINPLIIIGAILIVVGVSAWQVKALVQRVDRNDGYQPIQPIAFSHKVHAGDNQIPCQYCHYAADKGRHAGIPAASICMNCHSNIKKDSQEVQKVAKAIQEDKLIEWIKVHRMADFVYFDHSQHVRAGKLACQECHGPVEKMARVRQEKSLTMGWCIDCHRTSDVAVHGTLDVKKVSEVGGLDCAKCHY